MNYPTGGSMYPTAGRVKLEPSWLGFVYFGSEPLFGQEWISGSRDCGRGRGRSVSS
jgi:hypothetical protein